MNPPTFFFGIQDRARRRWAQLKADPELAGPWIQLFRQVQSPRHVLSELLQNADDAGAHCVNARIEDDVFVFEHDGADFSEADFASLCKFGFSNKRNLHTIGFRGIGFKSTFSLGDPVEVWTPSLHVLFRKDRFTLPEWSDNPEPVSSTMIGVRIEEQGRAKELQKNLDEWAASPASLLFFRNIAELRINDKVVRRQYHDAGPVPGLLGVELAGNITAQLITFRSAEEEFPPEAIEEVKQERITHDIDLPPCSVEIVLGLPGAQRLYVVLPTDVRIDLPFCCNAPFVQDPARMAIKDPAISPTNRWLLRRLGKTAAACMLVWLRTEQLDMEKRADAYRLLLSPMGAQGGLGDDCATLIRDGFQAFIEAEGSSMLLTSGGDLAPPKSCLAVPAALYQVWSPEGLVSIFGRGEQHLLASDVSCEATRRLVGWKWLDLLSEQDALQRLTMDSGVGVRPPRPPAWHQLLALWRFVNDAVKYDYNGSERRSTMIVPVETDLHLHAAAEVVRVSGNPAAVNEGDWRFLSDLLLVVDREWLDFLKTATSDVRDAGPAQGRRFEWLTDLLRVLGLEGSTPIDKVIAQAGQKLRVRQPLDLEDDVVRFTHIVAAINVQVPADFYYATRRLELWPISRGIICADSASIADLLPGEWAKSHLLHLAYATASARCSAEQWRRWARSDKSRLNQFARVESSVKFFWNQRDFEEFLRSRSASSPTSYSYRSRKFEVEDYDFDPDLISHWEQLAASCRDAWVQILAFVLEDDVRFWLDTSQAEAREVSQGGNYKKRVDCGAIPAKWLVRFAQTPCVPDTYGRPSHPAELLMRSPDTEPLLGVESFVKAEWDTESTKPLLKLLGVRDTPVGADKLVDRIRALASVAEPPIHEIGKWYDALDRIVARSRPENVSQLRQTFRSERLILTAEEDWATSDAVFQRPEEQELPGATVIHASVAQLSMWSKLGVAERPTFGLFLGWLNSLEAGAELAGADLRRVRGFLQRFPARIWLECGLWLALDGSWASIDQLDFALTKRMPVAFGDLFPGVRARTADLRMVQPETAEEPPFSSVRRLGAELEYRLTEVRQWLPASGDHSWIGALGRCLQRVKLDDDEKTSRVRGLAIRLARTTWQPVGSLRVTPYIDDLPAGQPSSPRALWHEEALYVPSRPFVELFDDIVGELGRAFGITQIADAIRSCAGRDAGFVTAYVSHNFQLDAEVVSEPDLALLGDPCETTELTTTVRDASVDSNLVETAADGGDTASELTSIPAALPDAGGEPPDAEGSTARTETEIPTCPEPSRRVKQPLIARYAFERGFRWDAESSAYVHTDGRVLRHSQPPLTWELYSGQGELLRAFWVSDQSLATSGVEIAVDAWECIRRAPTASSMILADGADRVSELTGAEVAEMVERDELKVFPAKYRLRLMSSS